jgi:predicted transcriptional regulator
MKSLTKVEEEIMHLIWKREHCTVSELLDDFGEPRPPHSSISSIVRILEKKGFVNHKSYGKTYEYFPIITMNQYRAAQLKLMVHNYFDGSVNNLVSHLVHEKSVNIKELQDIVNQLDN